MIQVNIDNIDKPTSRASWYDALRIHCVILKKNYLNLIMGDHQTYPFRSVKEWACNLQKRQDQEDRGLLRRARAGTTGMGRLERGEQILLLFGLVVAATGLLTNRFLNQFSDFALQMRWCGREGPLKEDYKRHQRRLLQVGSPPTVGGNR